MDSQVRLLKRLDQLIEAVRTEQIGPDDLDLMVDAIKEARTEIIGQTYRADAYRAMYREAEDKYARLVNKRQAGNRPKGRSAT